MSATLRALIGDRAPTRDDWFVLAHEWGLGADYVVWEIAPAGVACTTCWDHGVCVECLGQYPHICPMDCGDGRCTVCGRKGDTQGG